MYKDYLNSLDKLVYEVIEYPEHFILMLKRKSFVPFVTNIVKYSLEIGRAHV